MRRRLLTGATVWAGAACVLRLAWLLIEDEAVAAVGEQGHAPRDSQALNLSGHHILPGFVDVHLHLSQAAWFPRGGDAPGWRCLADALRVVRVAAGAEPDAPWLLFWCAARFAWPEGRLPTARELDQAAPGRRVLISTLDMHRGAVSPAGLAAFGASGQRLAHEFGDDVTKGRRGRPNGEVWEAAYGMVLQRVLADTQAHAGERGAEAVLAGEAARSPSRRPGPCGPAASRRAAPPSTISSCSTRPPPTSSLPAAPPSPTSPVSSPATAK